MPKILTEEEIKKVRKSIKTVSMGNFHEILKDGGIKPVLLNNGYKTSLSIDVIRENLRLIHLSVYNTKGETDTEMANMIAIDVIGEGCKMVGPMGVKNNIHFMKIEKENTMAELMKDIDTDNK